jgi:hypothetical protein
MIDPLDFGGDRGTPEQRREGLVDSLSDAIFRVSLLPKESPYLEMAAELERRKRAAENGAESGEDASLEARVAEWVRTRIGPEHMNTRERAMRLLEEAVELAQAEGITAELVGKQAAHVFGRRAGEPAQEAAGVAVCLLGWCAATGHTFEALATAELDRIEAKPIDQIRGSLARKADADLVTCTDTGTADDQIAPEIVDAIRRMMGPDPEYFVRALNGLTPEQIAKATAHLPADVREFGARFEAMGHKDTSRGVYEKFRVERTDGTSALGGKHHGCEYFVLDTIHDPHAKPALLAYAESCEAKYPKLAEDARRMATGERILTATPNSAQPTQPAACECPARTAYGYEPSEDEIRDRIATSGGTIDEEAAACGIRLDLIRDAISASCPCRRDYADMRHFQAKFIEADQERAQLRAANTASENEIRSLADLNAQFHNEAKAAIAERDAAVMKVSELSRELGRIEGGAMRIDRAEAMKRARAAQRAWRESCQADGTPIFISGIQKMEIAIADAIERAVRETAESCAELAR